MMGTPHKYADVIKAWADGAEIQFKYSLRNTWTTFKPNEFSVTRDFFEAQDTEWRVKPEVRRGKYRVALFNFDTADDVFMSTSTAETEEQKVEWERRDSFVRWLTDWVEYEY